MLHVFVEELQNETHVETIQGNENTQEGKRCLSLYMLTHLRDEYCVPSMKLIQEAVQSNILSCADHFIKQYGAFLTKPPGIGVYYMLFYLLCVDYIYHHRKGKTQTNLGQWASSFLTDCPYGDTIAAEATSDIPLYSKVWKLLQEHDDLKCYVEGTSGYHLFIVSPHKDLASFVSRAISTSLQRHEGMEENDLYNLTKFLDR